MRPVVWCQVVISEYLFQTTFLQGVWTTGYFVMMVQTLLKSCSGCSVTGRIALSLFAVVSPSVCLVDVVDGQLEGCGGESLWHGIASIPPICCGRHRCVLLQSSQSRCVGSVVCDGDVSSAVQATSCWNTLYVVCHSIDRSDWTALGITTRQAFDLIVKVQSTKEKSRI